MSYESTGERVGAAANVYAEGASGRDGARDDFQSELAKAFIAGVRYAARECDERELRDLATTRRR